MMFSDSCVGGLIPDTRIDTTRVIWDTIPMPTNDPLMALDTCVGQIIAVTTSDVVMVQKGHKQHLFQPLKHVSLSDVIEIEGVWYATSPTSGLSSSTNGGMTWHPDLSEGSPKAVASIHSMQGTPAVLTTTGEVFIRPTQRWVRVPNRYGAIRQLSATSSLLFAITDTAVVCFIPNHAEWTFLESKRNRKAFIASYRDTTLVYVGDTLLHIVNHGDENITVRRTPIDRLSVQTIAYGSCGKILASERNVYRVDESGNISSLPSGPWSDTKRITSCDCVNEKVVVSTNDPSARVLLINPNLETTWKETAIVTNTDANLDIIGVRGTPAGGLFIRARREGLWYSADTGRFAINVSNPMAGVQADAMVRIGNDFFVSTMFGGTVVVANCGERVHRVPNTLPYAVGTMVVTVSDSILVACLLQDRYYISHDRGRTWTPIAAPDTFGIVDKMFGIGNTVYLANPKGLRYAQAPDFTWYEMEAPSGCVNVQQLLRYNNGIILNSVTGAFYKPQVGPWMPIRLPDTEGPARFSTVATDGRTLVAAGKVGLYRSNNHGETWDFIPTPTRRRFIVLGLFQKRVWGFVDNGTICFADLP